ncbi:MAG: SDR family NAD(P)-dependent oxidoreductase [Phenylobacterium sp.]|uniref:oxidoreductase n=1 Tax=Phenylobacterium sp. TaxID=1871053 RepID=UPI0025CC67E5|nr:oxidoreductase [Phenylobacterium sp.]MCA6227358.1 SDR family NAD(P)-dependent oxidoreductase [Phenylobacterium sp.]MCA6231559.1 SDR family NAD(P)-dependent oxidoreductase [Phenylobacterium sp.]MCA6233599.1 SDR family NAD(P)-dependent oxidoreductase [Phenylobacterium sp.]MCA6250141.1 SDR family NAD(P)-dependent oxidoreductase [Phenylobacterium sp.]MCA6251063.1 SDR family NAD(P)-dependent oxidoreductase [Phenylobacterium sp.]
MSNRITSSFGTFSTAREVVAGRDLTGRTALVTGAATGIGIETARALAEAGADVVIAARKPDLAAAAAADINRTARGPGARFEMLDLSSLASIRALAARWGETPLDLLINNAGVMACPLSRTEDGLEMQIGTNHFGHFLLGVLLAPALEAGARASGSFSRLVSLSSIGHRRSGINWDDPNYLTRPYEKWEGYGQAKTANSLFAVGFHKRFANRGVTANAVMPGGIMTPLQRHMAREEMVAMGWIDAETGAIRQGFKTPEQGASTSIWAAVGPELEGVGGLYLENCAQAEPWTAEAPYVGVMPYALDPEDADRLWDLSREITGAW